MKRPSTSLVVLLLTLIAAPAAAQQPEVTVGQALTLLADHDGTNTTGYRTFLCPGTVTDCATQLGADLPATARAANGVVTAALQAIATRGTYTVQMSAFNPDRQTKSAPLVFRALLPAPGAPSTLRFLVLAPSADGSLQLKFIDAEQVRQVLELPPIAALDPVLARELESRSIPELLAAR